MQSKGLDGSTKLFLGLLLLAPVPFVLEHVVQASAGIVFLFAVVAILPLAEWMRRATEQVAHRSGSAIGGLLNVTFGNAAELILALFILRAGHADVVKAQITGSIIGNSLLGLGLAVVAGSIGRSRQTFNRDRAGLLGSLLILSVVGLLVPALFDYTEQLAPGQPNRILLDERMSFAVAVVLILVYAANLVYSLVTHRDVFSHGEDEETGDGDVTHSAAADAWPLWHSLAVLVAATGAIAWEAEMVSGALEATASSIGLTPFFLGIIPLAVIGNAAEYISAVYFARQNKMGLVMAITVGSTIQVALFVAPVLVLLSPLFGPPMTLIFSNPLELIAIAAVAFSVNAIAHDGETTWFEGVLLLAVYLILGIAFYFVTPGG